MKTNTATLKVNNEVINIKMSKLYDTLQLSCYLSGIVLLILSFIYNSHEYFTVFLLAGLIFIVLGHEYDIKNRLEEIKQIMR